MLSQFALKIQSLPKNQSGVAAIEFAFVFPVLVILLTGTIFALNLIDFKHRVENSAAAVADIVATTPRITSSELNQLAIGATRWMMQPDTLDKNFNIKVASVISCACSKDKPYKIATGNNNNACYYVLWARQSNNGKNMTTWTAVGNAKEKMNDSYPLSNASAIGEGETLIISEIATKYTKSKLYPNLNLTERRSFQPRSSNRVRLDGQETNTLNCEDLVK